MKLTAGAPSPVLIERLERAGWGDLDGHDLRGVRVTLAALARVLDPRSGQGRATTFQIATRAGYTDRWTRRCLTVLEELDLIEWERGGLVEGRPVPSWFRVSKAGLLALIHRARLLHADRVTSHTAEIRAKVARYRLDRGAFKSRSKRNRRSDHAELTTTLLSIEEVPEPASGGSGPPAASEEHRSDAVAQARAAIRANRGWPFPRGRGGKTATTTEERGTYATADDLAHTYAGSTVRKCQ